MQTYSHILIAASLSYPLSKWISVKKPNLPKISISALLFGSLLPDLALILIALACLVRDKFTGVFDSDVWKDHEPYFSSDPELQALSWTASLFDDWFFNNPIVISLQNTFHSPLLLIVFIGITLYFFKRDKGVKTNLTARKNVFSWNTWLFWVFIAALLHTLIDIPLHAGDGPLIAFPLNWSYRFNSPISYWDPKFYGQQWSIFEHCLDAYLIVFLLWQWRKNKTNR